MSRLSSAIITIPWFHQAAVDGHSELLDSDLTKDWLQCGLRKTSPDMRAIEHQGLTCRKQGRTTCSPTSTEKDEVFFTKLRRF